MPQNIRSNKETNNIKLKIFFQALATANDIEDNFNEFSDTTFHQTANEKVTVNTVAGQSEEKRKRKTTVVLEDSIVKRIQGRKLRRNFKQNVIVRSFPVAKLDCMSHHAIPTVKSNPDRIIIHCRTNNLKMDEAPEAIAENTFELAKSIKPTTNEVLILSIIPRRDKLADKGSKVNSILENFYKGDETTKFIWQKSLDSKKHIGKDGIYFNNFGI